MVRTEQRRRDGDSSTISFPHLFIQLVYCIDYYTLRNGNMEVSTRNTVPALSLQPVVEIKHKSNYYVSKNTSVS